MKSFKEFLNEAKSKPDHAKNHALIVSRLEDFATRKNDGLESDDHALFGYLHSVDGKKISINIIDPTDSGSYTLEVSKNGGRTNFYVDDSLSADSVATSISKILRNLEDFTG